MFANGEYDAIDRIADRALRLAVLKVDWETPVNGLKAAPGAVISGLFANLFG